MAANSARTSGTTPALPLRASILTSATTRSSWRSASLSWGAAGCRRDMRARASRAARRSVPARAHASASAAAYPVAARAEERDGAWRAGERGRTPVRVRRAAAAEGAAGAALGGATAAAAEEEEWSLMCGSARWWRWWGGGGGRVEGNGSGGPAPWWGCKERETAASIGASATTRRGEDRGDDGQGEAGKGDRDGAVEEVDTQAHGGGRRRATVACSFWTGAGDVAVWTGT
nr:unnamed protein product [Digitaria exilis]